MRIAFTVCLWPGHSRPWLGHSRPADTLGRPGTSLKALVWFWLIDETLSANLVYQSDCEIGSITPSGEANEYRDMMMVMPW